MDAILLFYLKQIRFVILGDPSNHLNDWETQLSKKREKEIRN